MPIAEATVPTRPLSPFLEHVIEGLSASQKQLSPKYFYDETGSQYFDEICRLDEYYPYRTEMALLPQVAKALNTHFSAPLSVVEFGAGSLKKIEPLLDHFDAIKAFLPIDISAGHLSQASKRLQQRYPNVHINPIAADFTKRVALPSSKTPYFGFFPGSTIGNFTPPEAVDFLKSAAATLGRNSHLLIGVDTKKSPELLHSAYNDAKGVTAKFNLNILHRINKELGAEIQIQNFEHYAHYNPEKGCVQMHLVSTIDQRYTLQGKPIQFRAGESIHTENSYKYSPQEFTHLAAQVGWQKTQIWLAPDNMFSLFLLRHSPTNG